MELIYTEDCFTCYGSSITDLDDQCRDCNGTGIITHGPWHQCRFCKEKICGCNTCQAYCNCSGYHEYYIIPYEEDIRKEKINE